MNSSSASLRFPSWRRFAVFLLLARVVSPFSILADVKLPAVLGDHMVLQRQMVVPIWGTDTQGQKVTVKFRGQTKQAMTGADGKWMVKLDPLDVGIGPDSLYIEGSSQITFVDVLVGDVWLGAGQSNMGLTVDSSRVVSDKRLAGMGSISYPAIRLFASSGTGYDQWKEALPANNAKFSAMLFAFGVPLQKELQVPVGLLVGAVGGTPSAYWLCEDAYRSDQACAEVARVFAKSPGFEKLQRDYEAEKETYQKNLAAGQGATNRQSLVEPQSPRPGELTSEFYSRDKKPVKVGHLYELKIRPMIPFAMRGVLWDQGESGTGIVGVDQYTIMGALIRSWRQDWGQGDFPFLYFQKPSGSGPAWDYECPMTSLAEKFSPMSLKFPYQPYRGGVSRETHIKIMNYPNTFMVTTSDLGMGIHPTNKSGYGERASRVALGAVYGKKIEIYGPIYSSHAIEGNKIRIQFTHIGSGLAFRNGDRLQGFAIAGKDQKYAWATAEIDAGAVLVSSPQVPEPVAVRYAWDESISFANLFNKEGLPALTFRTDTWPLELPEKKGGASR